MPDHHCGVSGFLVPRLQLSARSRFALLGGRARKEAEAARTLSEAGRLDVLTRGADQLIESIRVDEQQRWLYRIAALAGLGWICIVLYRVRGRLGLLARASGPTMARIWGIAARPLQAIPDRYDRWRDRWAPPDLPATAQAAAISRAQREDSRKTLGVFLISCLIGARVSDFYFIAYHNLRSISEVKSTVAKWPLPTDLRTQMLRLGKEH